MLKFFLDIAIGSLGLTHMAFAAPFALSAISEEGNEHFVSQHEQRDSGTESFRFRFVAQGAGDAFDNTLRTQFAQVIGGMARGVLLDGHLWLLADSFSQFGCAEAVGLDGPKATTAWSTACMRG